MRLLFPGENLLSNFRCNSFSTMINILWDSCCNHRAEKILGIESNIAFYLCVPSPHHLGTLAPGAILREIVAARAAQLCAQPLPSWHHQLMSHCA